TKAEKPKSKESLTFRVSTELADHLRAAANKEERTLSYWLRRAARRDAAKS
ncbi:unnamed protein product, partial [marine sediment metagenome]